jgi:quinol monooxygenase YgiN
MSKLHVVARIKIQEGRHEEFRQISRDSVSMVKEKEPGTTRYEWYLQNDGTEGVVIEEFVDSEAVLVHFQNMKALMHDVDIPGEMSIELFGDASPELLEAVKMTDLQKFSYIQGLG